MNCKIVNQLRYLILFIFLLGIWACEKDNTAPGEVTNLTARGGVEEVVMTWTEPVDEDLASIYITEVGAGKIYALPSGFNGVTIEGLTNGVAYEFAVVAVDKNGNKSNAVHASATPTPPFVMVDPDQTNYEPSVYVRFAEGYETINPSATFAVDTEGYVHISITFNRAMDVSSIVSEQTIYFEGSTVAPGTISISEDQRTLDFVSTEIFSSFGTQMSGASYTAYLFNLIMLGDDAGNGAVLDSNGMSLDGDEDGEEGGDLVLELSVYEEQN
jgi:hypothetical protein